MGDVRALLSGSMTAIDAVVAEDGAVKVDLRVFLTKIRILLFLYLLILVIWR